MKNVTICIHSLTHTHTHIYSCCLLKFDWYTELKNLLHKTALQKYWLHHQYNAPHKSIMNMAQSFFKKSSFSLLTFINNISIIYQVYMGCCKKEVTISLEGNPWNLYQAYFLLWLESLIKWVSYVTSATVMLINFRISFEIYIKAPCYIKKANYLLRWPLSEYHAKQFTFSEIWTSLASSWKTKSPPLLKFRAFIPTFVNGTRDYDYTWS